MTSEAAENVALRGPYLCNYACHFPSKSPWSIENKELGIFLAIERERPKPQTVPINVVASSARLLRRPKSVSTAARDETTKPAQAAHDSPSLKSGWVGLGLGIVTILEGGEFV